MANHLHNPNDQYLKHVEITGFKSIRDITIELRPDINVLIGANGSGKSNFIEVFDFVRMIYTKRLQQYVADKGGANSILHFGRDTSPKLKIRFEYFASKTKDTTRAYSIILHPNDQDQMVITSETAYYHERGDFTKLYNHPIATSLFESGLASDPRTASARLRPALSAYRIYHFHDASPGSPPRRPSRLADSVHLQSNGSNIASWLYRIREMNRTSFDKIEALVRMVSPFFDSFLLRKADRAGLSVRLEWKARKRDEYFNIAALSDGTVRFICLACLLLQPNPPPLILVDEPELGLHPKAIAFLAELLASASTKSQLIVSTQSVTLVNHFGPQHVWCVDRVHDATELRNLEGKQFIGWLEGYGLGDLWEHNLIWEENGTTTSGGGPA